MPTFMRLLICGIGAGLVFTATTVAATVWCAQLAVQRGLRAGLLAADAAALGQAIWAFLAVAAVVMLNHAGGSAEMGARVFAALIFAYMAAKSYLVRVPLALPATRVEFPNARRLAAATLAVTLSMPMRFFGYAGIFLVLDLGRVVARFPGVPLEFGARYSAYDLITVIRHYPGWMLVPLGAGLGSLLWLAGVGAAAARLADRVGPDFWGRAMRSQARAAGAVYALLAGASLAEAFFGMG